MGSFVGIAASGTGTSRGPGVGITCGPVPGDVPVASCSWRDGPVSRVGSAER